MNRCVAEGRERFRRFLVRRDGGARCKELAPLLSAFADEEAARAEVADLRDDDSAGVRFQFRAFVGATGNWPFAPRHLPAPRRHRLSGTKKAAPGPGTASGTAGGART